MSANAASLRRILRSIGSHANPSTTTRTSTKVHPSHTRSASQLSAPAIRCHDASRPRRQPAGSRQYRGVRPVAQTEADHRQAAGESTPSEQSDGTGGGHAGAGRIHIGGSGSAVGESEEGATATDADQARGSSEPSEDLLLPIRQIRALRNQGVKTGSKPQGLLKDPNQPQRDARRRPKTDSSLQGIIRKPDESQQNARYRLRVKKEGQFSQRYFQALERMKRVRMKRRARRHQILKERRSEDDDQVWPGIMRLLEERSPRGAAHWTKRTETLHMPNGILAKWAGNPGESILEVLQWTGSHVQVVSFKDAGLFTSLVLHGKPAQNLAAKRFLKESGLLQAVSKEDSLAVRSLSDYELRSEITGYTKIQDTGQVDKSSETEAQSSENDDELEDSLLRSAVDDTTGKTPTRAVWAGNSPLAEPFSHRGTPNSQKGLGHKNPSSFTPTSATSLTAYIGDLATEWPRGRRSPNYPQYVRDELVKLLTAPENIPLITPAALTSAMNYLAQHMHFDSVRDIMRALKDVKESFSAAVYNPLLAAAAKSENVFAFHDMVKDMRERNIYPDADTWVQFHTLMLKRFPDKAGEVIARMQSKAISSDLSARIDNIESYAVVVFESFLHAYPDAQFKDYVKMANDKMPGLRWLTTYAANRMCHSLLKKGNTNLAFQVIDELIRNGKRPDTATLNTFLGVAKLEGNMEMAVAILQKFHDLHAKSNALAQPNIPGRELKLPRRANLTISPNWLTFKLLSDIAWDRKQYNCLRVFWRYACCTGHVGRVLRKKIAESNISTNALEFKSERIFDDSWEGDSARGRLWNAFAAKFALGVKSGLQIRQGNIKTRAVNDLSLTMRRDDSALEDDSTSKDSGAQTPSKEGSPPAIRFFINDSPPATVTRRQAERQAASAFISDVRAAGSLRPTRPLVEMAQEAWLKDRLWKQNLLGLPKGLKPHKFGDVMFDEMLRQGVQVPVKEGPVGNLIL